MTSLTKKELANAAGYSYRQLYNIDKTLPPDKKLFVETKDGKYDLQAFVEHWVDYNVNKDDTSGLSLDDIKAQHEAVKMKKTELEVAQMEGELVDVDDVKRLWANIANTVLQNMLRLPAKIAVQVVAMENTEIIAGIIEKEVRDVLTAISDTPLPVYAKEESEEDSEE